MSSFSKYNPNFIENENGTGHRFGKFSIAHKLQEVSFVKSYRHLAAKYQQEHCLIWEPSTKENPNAVAVVRDSSLKGQNKSKFKATSWVRDMKKLSF